MRNKMNMKNKMHKCAPRNSQINLSAQEWEAKSEIARLLADFHSVHRTLGSLLCKTVLFNPLLKE